MSRLREELTRSIVELQIVDRTTEEMWGGQGGEVKKTASVLAKGRKSTSRWENLVWFSSSCRSVNISSPQLDSDLEFDQAILNIQ